MCIFDPIQAYLGGDTDMNRANEAREMTKKLGSIAERTGCAIVLIGHMNKGSGAKAAYRHPVIRRLIGAWVPLISLLWQGV